MYKGITAVANVWEGHVGTGRCQVSLVLMDTGAGLNGLLTGGEKPHIGGVVLAVPRPSLSDAGTSADLFITPVPNHKDVEVATTVADQLARVCGYPVSLSAGIHSENLTLDELNLIRANCNQLAMKAVEALAILHGKQGNLDN